MPDGDVHCHQATTRRQSDGALAVSIFYPAQVASACVSMDCLYGVQNLLLTYVYLKRLWRLVVVRTYTYIRTTSGTGTTCFRGSEVHAKSTSNTKASSVLSAHSAHSG